MAWDVTYTCDICGSTRREANHWWMVQNGAATTFDRTQPSKRFTLMPWNAAEAANPELHHLCGEGCAMKAMERFMSFKEVFPEKNQLEDRLVSAA